MDKGLSCAIAAVGVALLLQIGCGGDENPVGGGGVDTSAREARVEIISSPYSVSGSDLTVVTPEMTVCNEDTKEVVPPDTQTALHILGNDSLKISLSLMQGALSKLPGIDTNMAGMLSQISTLEAMFGMSLPLYAVFLREGSGSGIQGTWELDGLDLSLIRTLDSSYAGLGTVANTADSAVEIVIGHLQLDISPDLITGSADRQWYGQRMVAGLVDTNSYNVTVATVNDSTWRVTGTTEPAGGPVTVVVSTTGDLILSDPAGNTHTYYFSPATCPNALVPEWFVTFREANDAHSL
jgi:hypothetical protein